MTNLSEVFAYDPDTGVISRKTKNLPVSTKATTDGSLRVRFAGKRYRQHRLAFYLMKGRWPDQVDHINGKPFDNRWCNLREVTHKQNQWNKASNNVYRNPSGWQVQMKKDKKQLYFGRFKCFGEAVAAAREARSKVYGEYSRMKTLERQYG
jgi:hypothetical protein